MNRYCDFTMIGEGCEPQIAVGPIDSIAEPKRNCRARNFVRIRLFAWKGVFAKFALPESG